MLIGICGRPGTYRDRWVHYCSEYNIPFRLIDFNCNAFINDCRNLDGLLWHWGYDDTLQMPIARQIIMALESVGLKVFPNVASSWHYDDKISQKFLLEALSAPVVPSWIFTHEADAIEWINQTSWPKVFKLKGGAGSSNVRLVQNASEATVLCRRAFSTGFKSFPNYFYDAKKRVDVAKAHGDVLRRILNAPGSLVRSIKHRRSMPIERGYIYFQDFLPENFFDTRITVIGNRAFGFRRLNRQNDFRASGSGRIEYSPEKIDMRCVEVAFRVSSMIGAQSLAFDFIYDRNNEVRICEISYCYQAAAVQACAGYWNRSMNWHEGSMWPEVAIMQDFLAQINGQPLLS